jgi:acyl carrier protein
MNDEAIRNRVRELVYANAPRPDLSAGLRSRLVTDLDYDSLALASLVADLQEEFELRTMTYDWPDEMSIEALQDHVLQWMKETTR